MNDVPSQNQVQQLDMLDHALAWLSALPVALIVLLTFADVLGRYVFASPVRGSVEIIEYAMAMLIFTALPLVTRQRGHVSVSLIDNLFKGAAKRMKVVVCDAISALALGLLTWRLFVQGMDDLRTNASTVVLKLPHAPLSFALALFAALATLVMVMLVWRSLTQNGEKA